MSFGRAALVVFAALVTGSGAASASEAFLPQIPGGVTGSSQSMLSGINSLTRQIQSSQSATKGLLAAPLALLANLSPSVGASSNSAELMQVGKNNTAMIAQTGYGNSAVVAQLGAGNIAMVMQQGAGNTAMVYQSSSRAR